MSRYISRLPSEIKLLAFKRMKQQGITSTNDLGSLNWSCTLEGADFWAEIYNNNYKPFYDLYQQSKSELSKLIEWMEKEYISIPESDGNLVVIKTAKTILEKAKAIQNDK